MPPVPLIGRDDEIAQLRDIAGDLVLAGKPGVGKTFLLQELMKENWGLFDAGGAAADLEGRNSRDETSTHRPGRCPPSRW